MSKSLAVLAAPLFLSALSLVACSSSSDSPATPSAGSAGESGDSAEAGSSSGGSNSAGSSSGGSNSAGDSSSAGDSNSAGDSSESAGANTAGAQSMAGAGAGGAPNPSKDPCSYTVTGAKKLPEGDAMYLCTGNSRVYQAKGMGNTDALIGGAFYNAAGDSSTFACSIDSTTPPKAGDSWVMSKDSHPGDCTLGFQHNNVATLWAASSPLPTGAATITFLSVTKKNGTYKPEDVYYLYEVNITVEFKGQTAGAGDVSFTGHFTQSTLPLGA